MAEGKKRRAVSSRKAQTQLAKGTRRRQRGGSATLRPHDAYGVRSVTRTAGQGISITVQIPPLRRPKQPTRNTAAQSPRLGRRRLLRPLVLLPAAAVIGLVVYFGIFQNTSDKPTPAAPAQAAAAERAAPDFRPLVPSAEKASATKYDGKRNMVSYTTTFSGSRITVSQQALPDSFKKDPSAPLKAADSIRAKQQIDTSRGTVYIATNQPGDQLAIFADKQVLLLIRTDKKLDDASWKSFIELLGAKSWQDLT